MLLQSFLSVRFENGLISVFTLHAFYEPKKEEGHHFQTCFVSPRRKNPRKRPMECYIIPYRQNTNRSAKSKDSLHINIHSKPPTQLDDVKDSHAGRTHRTRKWPFLGSENERAVSPRKQHGTAETGGWKNNRSNDWLRCYQSRTGYAARNSGSDNKINNIIFSLIFLLLFLLLIVYSYSTSHDALCQSSGGCPNC